MVALPEAIIAASVILAAGMALSAWLVSRRPREHSGCSLRGRVTQAKGSRLFFLLMMPWALLPFGVSAGLWFFLKLGFLARIATQFRRWSARMAQAAPTLNAALPLMMCLNFLNDDFRLPSQIKQIEMGVGQAVIVQ